MENIEKIIEYIKAQSAMESSEIARLAHDECERIRMEYYREEQDEYWKAINAGTKESEQRIRSLNDLATEEANKKIEELRRDMLHETLMLAAEELRGLSDSEYKEILKKSGFDADTSPEELVFSYEEALSRSILIALFD